MNIFAAEPLYDLMPFINFNGLIAAEEELLLPARNRALLYGEGLIETMLWQKKTIRLFDLHVQRLQKSLGLLHLPSVTGKRLIGEICRTVIANNEPAEGIIRCQFFRNEATEEDIQFMIEYRPFMPQERQELRIGITRSVTKAADMLAGLKTSSRLLYVAAAREAEKNGWDDALLLNTEGRIVESTIYNVFWIEENRIYTPPLNEGAVAGVMRRYLLEQGRAGGMELSEKVLDIGTLTRADEIFLTNAVRGVRPVSHIGNKQYPTMLGHKIAEEISHL